MSDRKSNPLFALTSAFVTMGGKTIEIGIGTTKSLFALLGVGATVTATVSYVTKNNGVVENISKFPNVILNFFHQVFKILTNFPNGIFNLLKIIVGNIQIFFNVFIILVVLGHFDWLLEDLYSILGISLVITYATYR